MASSLLFKSLIGVTTVGAIGGAGVATTYMLSGQSIRTHIENSNKSKNKVFLTADNSNLADIKAKYTAYKGNKRLKPNRVTEEQLVQLCANNVDSKFKDENDDTYKSILAWCFINPNTISQEMTLRNKKLRSENIASHEDWKNAWDNYNRGKANSVLRIPEEPEGELNKAGAERVKGGEALHKWCTERNTESKKLYEEDIEETYEIFEAWCTVAKPTGG